MTTTKQIQENWKEKSFATRKYFLLFHFFQASVASNPRIHENSFVMKHMISLTCFDCNFDSIYFYRINE